MQLNYEEQEKLEQALFIELIRLAPATSELIVTTDSWKEMPEILGERLTVKNREWVIALVAESREFLIRQAISNNLQTKFVHFYIVENSIAILSSFDRMCSIVIEDGFPESRYLKSRYVALEVM